MALNRLPRPGTRVRVSEAQINLMETRKKYYELMASGLTPEEAAAAVASPVTQQWVQTPGEQPDRTVHEHPFKQEGDVVEPITTKTVEELKLEAPVEPTTTAVKVPEPDPYRAPVRVEPVKKKTVVTGPPEDNLANINGIGPGMVKRLQERGIHSFVQIADWSAREAAHIDKALGLKGRAIREDWVGQAKKLVKKG